LIQVFSKALILDLSALFAMSRPMADATALPAHSFAWLFSCQRPAAIATRTARRSAVVTPSNGFGQVQRVTTPTLSPLPSSTDELVPFGLVGRRGHAGLSVLNAEKGAPVLDACSSSFVFSHAVQRPRRSGLGEHRGSAAPILDVDHGAASLASVMHELDRSVRDVGNFGPCCSDELDRGVVVLSNAMRSDERVHDHEADRVGLDGCYDGIDDRTGYDRSVPGLFRDDDFRLAPGIDEKPPLDFLSVDSVVKNGCHNAPLQFFVWIFTVPYPDIHPLIRGHAEQGATADDHEGFRLPQARFSMAASAYGLGDELADVVTA
jgi:hypothetical protein